MPDISQEEIEQMVISKCIKDPEFIEMHESKDFVILTDVFNAVRELIAENALWVNGSVDVWELKKRTNRPMSVIAQILFTDSALYHTALGSVLTNRKDRAVKLYVRGKLTEEQLLKEVALFNERWNGSKTDDDSSEDFLADAISIWDEKSTKGERPISVNAFGALRNVLPVLRKGELIVLAARPAVGKSALALQIADDVVSQGHKVLYVTLEMEKEALARRYVQFSAPIGFSKFDDPASLSKEDWQNIYKSLDRAGGNLIVRKGLYTIPKIRRAVQDVKPDLVIIDQLTLIKDTNPKSDARIAMSNAAYGSKNIAVDYSVPVIALTQIRRPSGDTAPEPQLHDLKESGALEEAADSVIMIHRIEEKQMGNYKRFKNVNYNNLIRDGDTPILIKDAKGRNNGLAGACCLYEGKRFRFKDCYLDM